MRESSMANAILSVTASRRLRWLKLTLPSRTTAQSLCVQAVGGGLSGLAALVSDESILEVWKHNDALYKSTAFPYFTFLSLTTITCCQPTKRIRLIIKHKQHGGTSMEDKGKVCEWTDVHQNQELSSITALTIKSQSHIVMITIYTAIGGGR